MIKINVYKNGYEINGHSSIKTCAEVSLLAWACANTIYNKYDEGSRLYQSAKDNKDNINEGYSWMIFDVNIDGAIRVFEEWKHNLEVCMEHLWEPTDVTVRYVDEILIK